MALLLCRDFLANIATASDQKPGKFIFFVWLYLKNSYFENCYFLKTTPKSPSVLLEQLKSLAKPLEPKRHDILVLKPESFNYNRCGLRNFLS